MSSIIFVNNTLVGDLLTSDLSDQIHIEGIKFSEATGGVKIIVGAAHSDTAIAQKQC